MSNVSVIGGQMSYKNMKNTMEHKQYAIMKVNVWYKMLNDGMKPAKWLKANSKGTKVNFDYIQNDEQYNEGLDELDAFINTTNRVYGTDFSLKR